MFLLHKHLAKERDQVEDHRNGFCSSKELNYPQRCRCLIYEVSRPLARHDLMHRSTEYLEELSHLLPHGVSVRRINDFPKLNSTSGFVYKKEKGEERANFFYFSALLHIRSLRFLKQTQESGQNNEGHIS